jgi:hypothetical protein
LQELKENSEQRARQEQAIVELLQQRVELKEKMQRTPEGQRREVEARLLEVERNLEEHKRMLEQSARGRELLVKLRQETIADEDARVRAEKEMLETAQRLEGNRKARLISHPEPSYPPDAREKKIEGAVVLRFTVNHEGIPQSIQVKKVALSFTRSSCRRSGEQLALRAGHEDGRTSFRCGWRLRSNFNLNQEPLRAVAITRDGKTEFQQARNTGCGRARWRAPRRGGTGTEKAFGTRASGQDFHGSGDSDRHQ